MKLMNSFRSAANAGLLKRRSKAYVYVCAPVQNLTSELRKDNFFPSPLSILILFLTDHALYMSCFYSLLLCHLTTSERVALLLSRGEAHWISLEAGEYYQH